MQRYRIFILVTLLVFIIDQATKAVIVRYLVIHQSIEVVQGFFNITYVRNPGAAFGLFRESGIIFRTMLLTGISVVALIVIFFVYQRVKDSKISKIALSLVAGGALGNLTDRIRFGEVIDFIDIYVGRYHWPAFNIADSAITVGGILAIFFFSERHQGRKKGKASRK